MKIKEIVAPGPKPEQAETSTEAINNTTSSHKSFTVCERIAPAHPSKTVPRRNIFRTYDKDDTGNSWKSCHRENRCEVV